MKAMQKRAMFLLVAVFLLPGIRKAGAETQERSLPLFSEISLRIPAKLILEQGSGQKVTIEAENSTLDEIITEVSGRALVVRFAAKNFLSKSFRPGRIIIRVTLPEITGLAVSGSGDIVASDMIASRILDLAVSGSGGIDLSQLDAGRVKVSISGSGNVVIGNERPGEELQASISGSGNLKAADYEAHDVRVTIAGSGNAWVYSNGDISVKIAGSGNLYYSGNPNIDSSIAGSGEVREVR